MSTMIAPATPQLSAAETALARLGQALKETGYSFTTVTPATQARVNARPGNARAATPRDVFGWSRPFGPGVLSPQVMHLMDAAGVLDRDGDGYRSRVRFSCSDGDLFVHSAFPTKDVDSVFFGPDTLRLVGAVIAGMEARIRPVRRAVDIGTGSGAGAVAIARRAPGAEVIGVDINPRALRYATVNAALAGTPRVVARESDLLSGVNGDFDLIVSNPPFMIDPAGRAYRDGGGPDGTALPLAVLDAGTGRLAPGGTVVMLSGVGITDGHDPLRAAVARRMDAAGLSWTYREIDPDVYGEELDGPAYKHAERIAIVVLTATRPA